jgi:hypothetical protein
MSWEALRLTSKSPADVYRVLGPHGVESLLRESLADCWRQTPEPQRTVASVTANLVEAFERNLCVWDAICKPSPEAFFADLHPGPVDGHIRQALVLAWMMMPRAGGRVFATSGRIVRHIFQRILVGWREDEVIFTQGLDAAVPAPTRPRRRPPAKPRSRPRKTSR